MKIEVLRNTFWDGKAYQVGDIAEVSESVFDAMIAHGKAKPFAEPEAPITHRAIALESSQVEPKVTKRQWRKKSSPTNTED